MNVSSVKNLNGEVLSAVQDASLTNVIQTNSGNWQDITAYQNASATYLTEVSIPESATWNEVSTTVQTNSAQWGQGVNLSAVAQLLGVDETVLFTSSWNDNLWNVNLSEPVSSFKKIRMYVTRGDGANEIKTYEYETSLLPTYITLEIDTILTNDIFKYFTLCRLSGSTYTELSARLLSYPNTLASWNNTNSWCHPIKIVGIGRKA